MSRNFIVIALAALVATSFCREGEPVKLKGSETMKLMMKAIADEYNQKNDTYRVSVEGGGSEAGIEALMQNQADAATISRMLTAQEKEELNAQNKFSYEIGFDCLLLVVNKKNTVDNLTLQQASDLFAGDIKNWKEIGGPDLPVKLVLRDDKSGSAEYFKEHVLRLRDLGEDEFQVNMARQFADGMEVKDNEVMARYIAENPGAIGFMGMGSAEQTYTDLVKTLSYRVTATEQPVSPTIENVYNRTYKLSRPLYLVFSDENKGAESFYQFVTSDRGQRLVKAAGYLRYSLDPVEVTAPRIDEEDED